MHLGTPARRGPVAAAAYRVAVALTGSVVVLVGLVLVPLPGPGWPVVFVGLGILGSEFSWAGRLTGAARARLRPATDRLGRAAWPWRTAVGIGLVALAVWPALLLA